MHSIKNLIVILATTGVCLVLLSSRLHAASKEQQACLFNALETSAQNLTLGEIKTQCTQALADPSIEIGALSQRRINERQQEFDPFVITPHKMNYILPGLSTNSINHKAYSELSEIADNYEKIEAKFQISIKVPLLTDDLLFKNDRVYFAFTTEAWWQIYSEDVSKPFRETNYQPEVFYLVPTRWHPFRSNSALIFGLEHQSNGRSTVLSRSWNRYYTGVMLEKNNLAVFLRVWKRLNETPKVDATDSEGDDNPDIANYMGYFELNTAYTWNDYEVSSVIRQNFNTQKGALQLNFTFPLWGRLRGYAQGFTGYGESLIDYNHSQTRLGIGIALTDLL